MSAKHTPGPWRYEYEPGYCGELIAPDGMTIAVFVDEPRPYDACLIAAAPDLLGALQSLLTAYQTVHGIGDLEMQPAIFFARKCIAAATGETA